MIAASAPQTSPGLPVSTDSALAHRDSQDYAAAEHQFSLGNADRGTALLLDLVERNCSLWEPYNDLGVLAQSQGDLKTAIHFLHLAHLRETIPGTATLNYSKALVLAEKTADAIALWSELLSRHAIRDLSPALLEFVPELQRHEGALPALFDALKLAWRGAEISRDDDTAAPNPLLPMAIRAEGPGALLPITRLADLDAGIEVLPAETEMPDAATYHFEVPPQVRPAPFPALRMHEIAMAIIRPRSDTLLASNQIVVPNGFTPEHLLYDTANGYVTPLISGKLATAVKQQVTGHIRYGVPLHSYAVINWAHFLTEVLPIVALVEHARVPLHVPLIISEGTHPNMLELIHAVKAPGREVISIRTATCISMATVFSAVTTAPYDYVRAWSKQQPILSPDDCRFSARAFGLLRESLRKAGLMAPDKLAEGSGERIFIHRKTGIRRVDNHQQVADYFKGLGFRIVEPETLSGKQQVETFSRARVIVAQSGAGLSNMMFAPSGCRVVILTLDSPYTWYSYFTNIAGASGHHIHHLGFKPILNTGPHPGHDNMVVELDVIKQHAELFA